MFRVLPLLALIACIEPAVTSKQQADIACGSGTAIRGMDISYYDDVTDWNAVYEGGIQFAFIRVSDGTQFHDPKFASYWAGAKAAGVIRGTYQFFRPEEDPVAQADLLLQTMGPLEPGDLPPVIDVEVADGRTPAQVAAAVHAWIDHVAAAIGRPPIVYTGLYLWPELTGGADEASSPLWIAQYTTAPCPDIPAPWTRWMFWQDTDHGSTDGVTGSALDIDLFDGSYEDLLSFAGISPPPPPPPMTSDAGVDAASGESPHPGGGCSTGYGDGGSSLALALFIVRRKFRKKR